MTIVFTTLSNWSEQLDNRLIKPILLKAVKRAHNNCLLAIACNPATPIVNIFLFKIRQALTTQERKSELKRHRDIILATIDYILEKITADLANDDSHSIENYYNQQKQQIEKYYQKGRLDVLQKRLYNLTESPRQRVDLTFSNYIKGKTGYDIDIFEIVRIRVNTIIERNQIRNQKELNDVGIMFTFYKQHPPDRNKLDMLNALLVEFGDERVSKGGFLPS